MDDILALGQKVIIRTVTHYYTGEIIDIKDGFVFLGTAAWIPNTGRWNAALKTGKLEETEAFVDPVAVSLSVIVDVTKWRHALPQ